MTRIYALILVLAVTQVTAELIPADFIENVNKRAPASSRILSGWQARPGQQPHQVSLRAVTAQGGVGGCGGSLVSRRWILTAAHCTAQRVTVVIRAGVADLTRPQYMTESTVWYNYPSFDDNRPLVVQPDDISLLELPTPVTYSEYLQKIRVQPRADAFRNYVGEQAVTSGFGRLWTDGASPEVLQWVYQTMVSNERCMQVFGAALITPNSICSQFFNVTTQSVCQGDSGGPLVVVDSDGAPTLVGVTSFVAGGDFGCHSGLPAGFIRPGPFHSWFTQVSGLDFENLNEEEEEETTQEPDTTVAPETTEAPPSTPEPETETESPVTTPETETESPVTTPETETESPVTTPETETESPVTTPETETESPVTTPEPETEPPATTPEPEPEESEEESEEDSDSSEEDPELNDLLKRLEVQVKVKVRMNKFKKRHDVHVKH